MHVLPCSSTGTPNIVLAYRYFWDPATKKITEDESWVVPYFQPRQTVRSGRRGQYRIDRLLEPYVPDIAMPDLRHELAQCPHRRDMSNPCQVKYVD